MAKKDIKLYVLNSGRLTINGGRFLDAAGNSDSREEVSSICCYLIDHPKGRVLVDTGPPDEWASLPEVSRGEGRFVYEITESLVDQLARVGLKPADITFVVYSHLHYDHAGNLEKFPEATAVLQKVEYDFAFGEEAEAWGYEPAAYRALAEQKTLLVRGEHDLFGDGSVMLVPAPGHTPGHQAVLVRLKKSGPQLLCGDLFFCEEDRQPRRFPTWNTNWPQTLATMETLEQYMQEHGANLMIGHDWTEWEKWSQSPMPLS